MSHCLRTIMDLPSHPAARPQRAALAFIYVTVLLDMLAFGIIIPVLPHLIEQLAGGGIARAAWWVGIFSTVFAIVQFILALRGNVWVISAR